MNDSITEPLLPMIFGPRDGDMYPTNIKTNDGDEIIVMVHGTAHRYAFWAGIEQWHYCGLKECEGK